MRSQSVLQQYGSRVHTSSAQVLHDSVRGAPCVQTLCAQLPPPPPELLPLEEPLLEPELLPLSAVPASVDPEELLLLQLASDARTRAAMGAETKMDFMRFSEEPRRSPPIASLRASSAAH